jgi:type VI secretion system protein ImpF
MPAACRANPTLVFWLLLKYNSSMSKVDLQQGLMPSILDRLIDPESGGTSWHRGYDERQMAEAVERDLEDLLNTRQTHAGLPDGYGEVKRSIVAYGLPDLVSLNALTPQQRKQIGRILEEVVSKFEPRLKDVKATLITPKDSQETTIQFKIEARLSVDPAPEVAFDTILELTTGRYSVKSG